VSTTKVWRWSIRFLLIAGSLFYLSPCIFGQDTPWDLYIDEGNLAYSEQHFAEAEKQYLAAVKEAEKFGPQDSRLITSLDSLASVYEAQRRYAEAEPLYRRTLAIQENLLGLEHPDVADTLNNLAMIYKAQGKYPDAEPLYKHALAIREKALGPDHPELADSLDNLAMVYKAQWKYPEGGASLQTRTRHSGECPRAGAPESGHEPGELRFPSPIDESQRRSGPIRSPSKGNPVHERSRKFASLTVRRLHKERVVDYCISF
jgi:tetratricopeptide (TPR) repeat protein